MKVASQCIQLFVVYDLTALLMFRQPCLRVRSVLHRGIHVPWEVRRPSRTPLYIGGAVLYGVSIYVGFTVYTIYSLPEGKNELEDLGRTKESTRDAIYDTIAGRYDSDISLDETFMGLTLLRRRLVRGVAGKVMEVSAGTGRNLPYYSPEDITSLVLVDASENMLLQAKAKLVDGWKEDQVTIKAVPLEALSPTRDQFDVVLQTFGLCSVQDPVAFLTHLSQFCRPDGRIILMEHGRSKYAWLNRVLDNSVEAHVERWGCRYNRDIAAIIQACEGVLKVEKCERWHFGTTYIYHLRPL